MTAMEKIIHIMIAPESLKGNGAKYRRNRLANFLSNQEETDKVLWVYPFARRLRTSKEKPEKVYENMYQLPIPDPVPFHLTSLNPVFHSFFTKKLNRSIKDLNQHERKFFLWYTFPVFPGLVDNEVWDKIIYDCSDNWGHSWMRLGAGLSETIKYGINRLLLKFWKKSENKILKNVDLVFATSEYLKRKNETRTKAPVHLVENGVEFEKFSQAEKGESLKDFDHPRLGYIGATKLKIDISLINKVAGKHPKWNFIFIGPRQGDRFEGLLENNKNVHWLGKVEPNEISSYLKQLDISLMPYRAIEYNKGVFPLKFFEYLACGLPVVGCGLPSTRGYEKEKVYVHTKANAKDFSKGCKEALNWNGGVEKRINTAKDASWDKKLEFMYNIVLEKI